MKKRRVRPAFFCGFPDTDNSVDEQMTNAADSGILEAGIYHQTSQEPAMLRLLIATVMTLSASLALAAEPESTLNMKSDLASDNPQIDWAHAKPVASLSVTPWESPKSATSDATPKSLFMIRGKVLDAVTGKTLSEPTLLIAAGAPATIEMGSASGYMLKVVVEVSPDKTSASSTSELKYSGVVMNSTTTMFKL